MKAHNYLMYGSTRTSIPLVLRPMTDDDIPTVQAWYHDPAAFYWRHQNSAFRPEHAAALFHKLSSDAFCFIIETDGKPIGETFLKSSTSPEMIARYSGYDVRCINVMIGDPAFRDTGVAQAVVGMMTYFAFVWIGSEVINISGILASDEQTAGIFLNSGYKMCKKELTTNPGDGQVHMTVELEQSFREYIERHRKRIARKHVFTLSMDKLQPSQLYVSQARLDFARKWFVPTQRDCMDACPVRKIGDRWVLLDGHVRAVLAYQAGWVALPLYENQRQDIDLEPYLADVELCEKEGVFTATELTNRIVPHKDYELLWRKRIVERNTKSRYL